MWLYLTAPRRCVLALFAVVTVTVGCSEAPLDSTQCADVDCGPLDDEFYSFGVEVEVSSELVEHALSQAPVVAFLVEFPDESWVTALLCDGEQPGRRGMHHETLLPLEDNRFHETAFAFGYGCAPPYQATISLWSVAEAEDCETLEIEDAVDGLTDLRREARLATGIAVAHSQYVVCQPRNLAPQVPQPSTRSPPKAVELLLDLDDAL